MSCTQFVDAARWNELRRDILDRFEDHFSSHEDGIRVMQTTLGVLQERNGQFFQ